MVLINKETKIEKQHDIKTTVKVFTKSRYSGGKFENAHFNINNGDGDWFNEVSIHVLDNDTHYYHNFNILFPVYQWMDKEMVRELAYDIIEPLDWSNIRQISGTMSDSQQDFENEVNKIRREIYSKYFD